MRAASTVSISAGQRLGFLIVVGAIACAIAVGSIIALAGSSSAILLGTGAAAVLATAGLIAHALDLSLIAAVRYGFVLSFFVKNDFTLFKIDEVEDPSGLNLSITLSLAVCLIVYDLVIEERPAGALPRTFWMLLGGLFIAAMASAAASEVGSLGWFSVFSLGSSMLIAVAVAMHFGRRERIVDLIYALALGVGLTGLVALSQYLLDFPRDVPALGTGTEQEASGTQSELLGRVPAFLRTPTGMAFVLTTLMPLIVSALIFRIREISLTRRLLLAAAGMLGTVAVILSQARGSWIGLLVGLALPAVCSVYWVAPRNRMSHIAATTAALLFAGLLLLPLAPRIHERLTADDEGSAAIRIPLMETAVEMIRENPLVGVGLNGYRTSMTRYDDTGMFVTQEFPNPVHNVFAHVAAEVGLPGGIIFCLLIVAAMIECFRSVRSGDMLVVALAFGVGVGLLAFVITAMKEPGSLGSARPPIRTLFLMLGAAMALSQLRRGRPGTGTSMFNA